MSTLITETAVPALTGHAAAAVFSHDRAYRYLLTRSWDQAPTQAVAWIMLNPSTADADTDDPTITRCVRFTRRWGYGGLAVVNLFALRATEPRALAKHPDPVGPENAKFIADATGRAELVIAAWGAFGGLANQDTAVLRLLAGTQLHCLGVTAKGHPRHPLYLRADTDPTPFRTGS